MKKIFLILLLLIKFITIISATDYYVSATGDDGADGRSESTPWKSITKVNSFFAGLFPGDRILFNRGNSFYGTLIISRSGFKDYPITLGAYGIGVDPIIDGLTTISSWIQESKGIYSAFVTCQSNPNIVTVDGVNTPMGRYPNTGYLTYESHSGTSSITDNQLPISPNWTGAEIVIRKNAWVLDRNLITNHDKNVLSYTALGYPFSIITDGYGYFIQNDIKTLDRLGDWYYGGGKLYMYFGVENPDDYVVKISSLDRIVSLTGRSYITLDHLTIEGANICGINITDYSTHVTIQNCDINFSGKWAINVQSYSSFFTLNNCIINNTNDSGILIREGSNNSILTNNLIQNTGTVVGAFSTWGARALDITSDNSLVQFNKIINTGYNGIQWHGNNAIVKNNLIDTFCTMMDDGAGIYTTGLETGRIISENIILNGKGNPEGTSNPNYFPAEGIYLDEPCANVLVINNTIAYCAHDGIKLHEAHDNTIINNTCFSNKYQIEYCGSGAQPLHPISNNLVNNNIFFARRNDQFVLSYLTSLDGLDAGIHPGTSNFNFYSRPINDDKTFNIYQVNIDQWPGVGYSLEQWKMMSGQDSGSLKSSVNISLNNNTNTDDFIKFLYNSSKYKVDYDAKGNYCDLTGKKYSLFSLQPFTSIILINLTPYPKNILGPIIQ
jgi:parallel beta-helix repeat protein